MSFPLGQGKWDGRGEGRKGKKERRKKERRGKKKRRVAGEDGRRLVMMHQGKAILDKAGEEKKNASVDDLLTVFNSISIELGN